jgi:hypothetical protein
MFNSIQKLYQAINDGKSNHMANRFFAAGGNKSPTTEVGELYC